MEIFPGTPRLSSRTTNRQQLCKDTRVVFVAASSAVVCFGVCLPMGGRLQRPPRLRKGWSLAFVPGPPLCSLGPARPRPCRTNHRACGLTAGVEVVYWLSLIGERYPDLGAGVDPIPVTMARGHSGIDSVRPVLWNRSGYDARRQGPSLIKSGPSHRGLAFPAEAVRHRQCVRHG